MGTLFGISYSKEWLSDAEREQFESEYRKTMNRYLLILAIVPVVTFFIPYFSITFSIWMIWMMVMIVMCMQPFYTGYQKLLALKKERCPQDPSNRIIYAELKNAGQIRCVKWQEFIPPCLVSVLLAIFSGIYFYDRDLGAYWIMIVIFALCTLLFYAFAEYTDRMKTKVISNDSDVNVNYTRASKNILKKFWLLSSWINNAFILVMLAVMIIETSFHAISFNGILWSSIIYSIIELYLCMRMFRQTGNLAKEYEKYRDLNFSNEEDHWIGGILYFNPKDKHTMVSKRVGVGTTVNLATTGGKVFGVITIASLLLIPIMCIWIILLEFVPISLFVKDDALIARQLKNDYVIHIDTITELTLEDELPRSSRVSGTGMDNLKKGNYRNSIDGRIQLFLNPQNQYYLRIVSEDTIYYIGGYDDEETLEIYHILSGQ